MHESPGHGALTGQEQTSSGSPNERSYPSYPYPAEHRIPNDLVKPHLDAQRRERTRKPDEKPRQGVSQQTTQDTQQHAPTHRGTSWFHNEQPPAEPTSEQTSQAGREKIKRIRKRPTAWTRQAVDKQNGKLAGQSSCQDGTDGDICPHGSGGRRGGHLRVEGVLEWLLAHTRESSFPLKRPCGIEGHKCFGRISCQHRRHSEPV